MSEQYEFAGYQSVIKIGTDMAILSDILPSLATTYIVQVDTELADDNTALTTYHPLCDYLAIPLTYAIANGWSTVISLWPTFQPNQQLYLYDRLETRIFVPSDPDDEVYEYVHTQTIYIKSVTEVGNRETALRSFQQKDNREIMNTFVDLLIESESYLTDDNGSYYVIDYTVSDI